MIVVFLDSFKKDLLKIDNISIKKKIKLFLIEIENSIKLQDIKNIKKLTSEKHAYRFKLGNYRIGFYCYNDTVEMVRIAHRKDIYKIFP
jgi:mRNA interferase RelE/StbE